MVQPAAKSSTAAAAEPRLGGFARYGLDFATLLGLIGAFALIGGAMSFAGSLYSFVDLPSALIVFGGTFAVTMVCFSLEDMLRAQLVVVRALVKVKRRPALAAINILKLADHGRTHGLLALDKLLPQLAREPFFQRALQLVVDGIPSEEAERIMRQEMAAIALRHVQAASILRKSAEVAPAMGLIGTLVGLVQMLGNLSNPGAIGPSMALALLTTLYGAMLANMVFSPLAAKLERNSIEERLINELYLIGALSIGRHENPRRLEMLLNAILPPSQRVRVYD